MASITKKEIQEYYNIQTINLTVLQEIKSYIHAGVTEKDIVRQCEHLLQKLGINHCWYHGVMAFVLVGERTMLSLSGRDYIATDTYVRENDLVTIDLSPERNGYWGDCARSYRVESGSVTDKPHLATLAEGMIVEKQLHNFMQKIVTADMEMHQLYIQVNEEIDRLGYKNLDFHGNIGHSIEKHIDSRRYIENNNHTLLGAVPLFTFEPHIAHKNGIWGFKHENIYYFENGRVRVLGDTK